MFAHIIWPDLSGTPKLVRFTGRLDEFNVIGSVIAVWES